MLSLKTNKNTTRFKLAHICAQKPISIDGSAANANHSNMPKCIQSVPHTHTFCVTENTKRYYLNSRFKNRQRNQIIYLHLLCFLISIQYNFSLQKRLNNKHNK